MARIRFINNAGAGFAEDVDTQRNETVQQFLSRMTDSEDLSRYVIRVNRDVVTSDYVLKRGDTVSATPSKIQGA